MEQENLYKPPSSDLRSNHDEILNLELASRWKRLGAAILDSIILGLIGLALFGIASAIINIFDISFELNWGWILSFIDTNEYLATAVIFAFSVTIFMAVNGHLLINQGQTVGKKILDIRIVDEQGNLPDVFHIIGLRFIAISLIGLIPLVGEYFGLIDILFIFGPRKKCLHDHLAKTKVVDNKFSLKESDNSTQNSEKSSIVISDEEINASGIKYSEYSRQELLEILNAIDQGEFPERVKLIELALNRFE